MSQHIKNLHPDWEYKLWTLDNLPKDLENMHLLNNFDAMMYKSDIIRYSILKRFGGIYLDTDYIFFKNIDDLLEGKEYMLTMEQRPSAFPMNNCFIGCVPESPIMEYAANYLPYILEKYKRDKEFLMIKKNTGQSQNQLVDQWLNCHPKWHGLSLIGPGLLMSAASAAYGKGIIFPPVVFSYYSYMHTHKIASTPVLPTVPEECRAIHLYASQLMNIRIHEALPCYKDFI